MRNLWMYRSVEIFLAGASDAGYYKAMGLPTGGKSDRIGWGRSPKQAYMNSFKNVKNVGNVDVSTILYDHAYFLNGKEVIRAKYSDKIIKSDGSVTL